MASKRAKRRKCCTGKIRHKTREAAMQEIYHCHLSKGLTPYKCSICGYWHVGHMPRKRRR